MTTIDEIRSIISEAVNQLPTGGVVACQERINQLHAATKALLTGSTHADVAASLVELAGIERILGQAVGAYRYAAAECAGYVASL